MKKIILILIAITAIVAGCQKYEEGPCISFRSARNRLYGDYTLTKYTIDGVDSLQQMKDRFGLSSRFFYNDYSEKDNWAMDDPTISNPFISRYTFVDNNKAIRVPYGSEIFTGKGNFDHTDIDFTILKLKSKDVHLKAIFNNKEYYLELN